MKIYNSVPENLIRVCISKQGEQAHYLTFCECTQDEVLESLKRTIEPFAEKFPSGSKTRIDVREAIGGKNGKSKSFHFYGISPNDTYNLIMETYGY